MSSRYYCGDQVLEPGTTIELPADESRHLLKTMRARTGDSLVVFGSRGQFAATLHAMAGSSAVVQLHESLPCPPSPAIAVTFLVPWIKGGKTEFVAQKLTELGAHRIIVFHAAREVAKGDDAKIDRLRRVIIEACKQCERCDVPPVETAANIGAAFALSGPAPGILLHERQGSRALSDWLKHEGSGLSSVTVASGPEGGWDERDLATLPVATSFVHLGQRILRAETAPLAAAAAIQALTGDM